jgi:hypothetical protein
MEFDLSPHAALCAISPIVEGQETSQCANNCIFHKEGLSGVNRKFSSLDDGNTEATMEITDVSIMQRICIRTWERVVSLGWTDLGKG